MKKSNGFENKVPFLTQSKLEEQGANFVVKDDFTSHVEKMGNLSLDKIPNQVKKLVKHLQMN